MSIAQVHLKGEDKLELHHDVVVYFCFSALGFAAPLCPGDFLIFNALMPHCILSRGKQTDNIYCVSTYLKFAIVGMNNNIMPLTTKQAILSKMYQKIFQNNMPLSNGNYILCICRYNILSLNTFFFFSTYILFHTHNIFFAFILHFNHSVS
jgi:hypothetical protein